MTQGILYISYDGVLEPLGQSQVLAYLERLGPGRRIHLISYEKAGAWSDLKRREAIRRRLAKAAIAWHPLRYHKSPTAPATAYDVALGSLRAIALARHHRLDIVHARSYVAALVALAVKRFAGAKFLFDMRGLWADERVDGGLWRSGAPLYRSAKRLERRFLEAADHVVTLTHASESEISRFGYLAGKKPPITVIPTCVDLERFAIQDPKPEGPFILGYIGSVGTWYLLDEMLRFFRELQAASPGARLLIVNRGEHQLIGERIVANGIDPAGVDLASAEHHEMPRLIGRMNAGMALIKPAYSKIASAPTKLAEYLACGVPCLGNAGVGDMQCILEGKRVGVSLRDFSDSSIRDGVVRLISLSREPDLQHRCRETATRLFSLQAGAARYAGIYDDLTGVTS